MTITLTVPPNTFTAGDSVAFTWSHTDYPASGGWGLTFVMAGPSVITSTATANVDAFNIAMTAAQTAVLTPGAYQWRLRAVLGTTTTTVGAGRMEVRANLDTANPGDFTSWAETTLVMLEASIQGDVTDAVAQWMIGDRQMTKIPMNERIKLRNQLRAEVAMAKSRSGFGAPIYMTPKAVS